MYLRRRQNDRVRQFEPCVASNLERARGHRWTQLNNQETTQKGSHHRLLLNVCTRQHLDSTHHTDEAVRARCNEVLRGRDATQEINQNVRIES